MLVASCSSPDSTGQSNPTTVADSSCTLFSPIYTYGKDSELMDIRTVREINTHNDTYVKVCGEPK
ncbi:hypothetical protein [Erwinia sp. QL-Z3]|uniref:hypothetical protein n=1 Tax=Erwinia sp. QL-Z3 TaxID=2547962 RepID=UPI001070C04D|nr:hypothetical protein [Erwinia sp. QL-Z3]QBR52732.1 hypothetical protein E2F51_23430 [Erwinia sp. QL-Z3]